MIIIETGESLPNSNSYADRSKADAYFADREIGEWAAEPATARDAALIRATDFLDSYYVFRSVRAHDDQALENPRFGQDDLHPSVVRATIELALIALKTDLYAPPPERDVITKETTVGSTTTKTTYDKKRVVDPYPSITRILKTVASRRGGSSSTTMMTR